jgi:hypothetical protein
MEWGDRSSQKAIAFPLQAVSVAERIVADVEAILDHIKACGNDSAVIGNNFEGSKDVQMLVGVRVTNRVDDRHKFFH